MVRWETCIVASIHTELQFFKDLVLLYTSNEGH